MVFEKNINYARTTLQELEDKELDGIHLSSLEEEALQLFRKVKLEKLTKIIEKEEEFHLKYEYFRELSNFLDYQEFLAKPRFNF